MQTEQHLDIFSEGIRDNWNPIEPSIWTTNGRDSDQHDAASVLRTLLDQPRWLEARHLYDERGSRLFEEICELPEYYLTRTENAILARQASAVIAMAPVECIVELGAGFSKKTDHLLREQVRQRRRGAFAPVDVSLTGLTASRDAVQREFPELKFHGLLARFEEGIGSIDKGLPTLVVFLGSTIGNFTRPELVRFFHDLSNSLGQNDFLLLGVDRVKDVSLLEAAYNDTQGRTAEFILNAFNNINRRMDGDFDLGKMRYYSCYNPDWQQVEMYAVSTCNQHVHFPSFATSLRWEKDEKILVEISRKFEPGRLQKQLRLFGLEPIAHFTDSQEWFSLLLFRKS